MKKIFVFSLVLFSGINIIAQDIDLSKFAVPEYRRNELEFDVSASNGFSGGDRKSSESADKKYNHSTTYGSRINVSFGNYKNNQLYQGRTLSQLYVRFPSFSNSVDNSKISDSESKRNATNLTYSLNSSNRFYFTNKKYFEIAPDVNINWYKTSMLSTREDTARSINTESDNSSISMEIGSDFRFGKGRVEPVEDLRQVIYILKDLEKAGKLKREITQDEAVLLAEKLSVLKNKRFLDSRLRLIEEMTEIEKIMTEMDLITDNDAAYFSTVYDYWSMTANPLRQAGKRMSFGVLPSYNFNGNIWNTESTFTNPDTITSDKSHYGQYDYSVLFSARYEQFKPIDLYWQQDYSAEFFTNILGKEFDDKITDYNTNSKMALAGITANYNLRYYPNSRTSYSGYAGATCQYGIGKEDNTFFDPESKYRYFQTNLGISSEYYFSPQLTVKGSAGLVYLNQLNRSSFFDRFGGTITNKVSLFLNFGLVYKMF